jgi:creatinine amidohydrolase
VSALYLPRLSYPQVEALRARDPIVFLPIGAIEAHGPHLPLETDTLLSLELSRRAAAAMPERACAIAAPIGYSVAGYAGGFAGTVSLAPETATALLRDVGLALLRMGLGRLCLVNSHLDPAHVETIQRAIAAIEAQSGARVAFPDQLEPRWGRTLSDEYKRGACHAGSYETSLLMASPERTLVDDAARAGLPIVDINLAKAMKAGKRTFEEAGADRAYFGDPAHASVEEGEWLYARLVEMVVTTVRETWPGASPSR